MQYNIIPRNVKKIQNLSQNLLWTQHKLFVMHSQALVRANLRAEMVHGFHCRIPLLKTASKALQIKSSYGNCPWDDRVNNRTAITYHKKKLRIWKHSSQFVSIPQCERIIVTKTWGWLSMLGDDLQIQFIQSIKTPSQKQSQQFVLFKIKLCRMLLHKPAWNSFNTCDQPTYFIPPNINIQYAQYINIHTHTYISMHNSHAIHFLTNQTEFLLVTATAVV